MGNNSNLPLLDFVDSDTRASAVLVIESIGYLSALRKMFPDAELFAVVADEEAARRPELEGLGVHWEILDYRETVLPFPRRSFDIVIAERMLENVTNPQDIASGVGTFIKDTGFLLTSFENIRYWRVLQELMDGHFYAIVHRRYAKPEFERLLYASFYKDIFFAPVRKPGADGVIEKLVAAGFENRVGDLDTEVWLVQALRSSVDVSVLKAEYAPKERKRLATLMRRIEYDIDAEANVASLWRLADEVGFSAEYLARFVSEIIVHRREFLQHFKAFSQKERGEIVDEVAAELMNGEH